MGIKTTTTQATIKWKEANTVDPTQTFTLSTPVALRPSLKNSGSRLGSPNPGSTYRINGTRLGKKEKSVQKSVIYDYSK